MLPSASARSITSWRSIRLMTSSGLMSCALLDEETLDRSEARQPTHRDEHFQLALRQTRLGLGEGKFHPRVARRDEKRLAVATVGLGEDIRNLVHVALAVGERFAERLQQRISQRRVLLDQSFVDPDHVFDHLAE